MVETITRTCDMENDAMQKGLHEESSRQIISSISHELRTPLSIISSNLQMLQSDNGQMDSEIRAETYNLCEEAIKSMSRFLDDVYFLNVSIKGELKRIPEKFNLFKYFEKIVKEFSFTEYDAERLKFDLNLEKKKIVTDKELVNRVVHNVISNALKFSPEEVVVRVSYDGAQLHVEVEDKGIGIPEDDMELIFEPFFRGHNVKMISGTGLGMSIIKRSIDCLGGEISIDSKVGEGTIVKLNIPNDGE